VIRRLLPFVSVFLLTALPVVAGPKPKVDKSVTQAVQSGSADMLSVIITVTSAECRISLGEALEAHGDRLQGDLASGTAIVAEVHADDIAALADSGCVVTVSDNAEVEASAKPGGGGTTSEDLNVLRETLGITSTTNNATMLGVAIVDSGIEPLRDFGNRITAFYDFTAGGIAANAHDDYGHGTHIAGLIGGDGTSGVAYKGLASGVRLIGLKVLDGEGKGQTSDVINALDFATANKDGLGIDIINLSLGHPVYESAETDPLVQAVERAVRAGIVVIASAGNFGMNPDSGAIGYAGITSPGNAPSALTVGAFRTQDTVSRLDDRVAEYSSRGPTWFDGFAKPDLLAPGTRLVSLTDRSTTIYQNYPDLRVDTKHLVLSGSSMATAVASGVAALVLEKSRGGGWGCASCPALPGLTPNALKAVLQYSALTLVDDSGYPYDPLTQGAGGLNAAGALTLAGAIDTSVPVGDYWLTTGVLPETTIDGQSFFWSENIVWGSRFVTGDGVIDVHQMAWTDNIVWGAGFFGDNIVWGSGWTDNIVWGSTTFWSENIVWGSSFWGDNIVWGSSWFWADNIVWGSGLLGEWYGDNIVWGRGWYDNIVWGSNWLDNIVWGSLWTDNIVWGSNIVWASVYEDGQ
jgi:serine protease AprX